MGWFREAHRYGNRIFAVRTSRKKKSKWRLIATVAPRLRVSLEEFSFKALEICPLVSCQHPDMGVLYSFLPKKMYEKLPSLDEIHCNTHKTIDLGELEDAPAVIKAAKKGFNAALKEGGTHHWFVRQLIMACQPCNRGLTFCNAWMIHNALGRFIIDYILEDKAMATLEKAGLDMVALKETLQAYVPLKLKPHDKQKILAKAQLKASVTDHYQGEQNIGRRFACKKAWFHINEYGGVWVFMNYYVDSKGKRCLKTIFVASKSLKAKMKSREPVSSPINRPRRSYLHSFVVMAFGARRD